jgi:hypothetical protein
MNRLPIPFSRRLWPICLLFAACCYSASMKVEAATLIWNPAQNVVDPSDVRTDGVLVTSASITSVFTPTNPVVNGVVFTDLQLADLRTPTIRGNVQFVVDGYGGSGTWGPIGNSSSAPFANLSGGYRTFLSRGLATDEEVIRLTISGLIVGQDYLFQWWSSMAANIGLPTYTTVVSARTSANGGPIVDANLPNAEGGLGQHQVGTFRADSTAQVFEFRNPAGNQFNPQVEAINGFQLRRTSPIPEPGSLTLLLASGGCLCLLRRR